MLNQMFTFSEKRNSILAGFTYVLCINTFAIVFLLLTFAVSYLFKVEQIGFNFFLLYMINLIIFSKHLFLISATFIANEKRFYFRNDWGTLLGCIFMISLISGIAITKFELLPVTENNSSALVMILFFTHLCLAYCAFSSQNVVSKTTYTIYPSEIDGTTFFIEKKKLYILRGAFVFLASLLFYCLLHFLAFE